MWLCDTNERHHWRADTQTGFTWEGLIEFVASIIQNNMPMFANGANIRKLDIGCRISFRSLCSVCAIIQGDGWTIQEVTSQPTPELSLIVFIRLYMHAVWKKPGSMHGVLVWYRWCYVQEWGVGMFLHKSIPVPVCVWQQQHVGLLMSSLNSPPTVHT